MTDFSGMFSSSKNHKGTVYEYKDGKLNMTIGDKGSMLLDANVVTLWDTSAATTFANMFANAIRLEKVNISSWNMHNKTATDMFLNCAGLNEITLGTSNVLDDTAFGPDMFFIETVPTRANGGTHTDVNVYWRSNVDINADNNKLTYNGVTWEYGNIGGTWFAQDANRPTGNDFTGTNIWSGSTSNLLALYPAPIAAGVQAHKAPARRHHLQVGRQLLCRRLRQLHRAGYGHGPVLLQLVVALLQEGRHGEDPGHGVPSPTPATMS